MFFPPRIHLVRTKVYAQDIGFDDFTGGTSAMVIMLISSTEPLGSHSTECILYLGAMEGASCVGRIIP